MIARLAAAAVALGAVTKECDGLANVLDQAHRRSHQDLEKTKEALHKSANNLRLANDKIDDLTIVFTQWGNPQ
jgi:hypothetical protein